MSFSLAPLVDKLQEEFELDEYNGLLKGMNFNLLKQDDSSLDAFCINLFCIEDGFANMAYELVKAAYLILPNYDYCILTVQPTIQEHPLWKNFTLVSPRSDNFSPCVLYINNRFSESVTVRPASEGDMLNIAAFLKTWRHSLGIYNEVQQGLNEPDNILAQKAFIIEKSDQIVGIATLGQCLNSSQVVDQFDVAKFINISRDGMDGKYVYLRNFMINSIFEAQSRFVFRVS